MGPVLRLVFALGLGAGPALVRPTGQRRFIRQGYGARPHVTRTAVRSTTYARRGAGR
ncbi:hypothetical protein [Streptomyces sp. NPDC006645]|uniref:hypothetical protein n=1 Tax=unclassified Streptomyces TaxID=2593676 RepID=UPI0033ABCB37